MANKKIKLNNDTSFDTLKLLESRAVFLANSGGGKSYAIRKFAEGACEQVQTIIIDPEGEFDSLREQHDFILAGKNKDVPVEIRSAALLATRLLELGKSAIIDLYELHPQDRQRYVKLFFDAMLNAPKDLYHPVFIVLDEAHEYAPEGKPSEATWAVEALASKGRKRGFCLIPATQRISKLSKNISAECNNKLIGRASQDIDMKRAGDELGFSKEKLVQLRQLKPGEFFAFGPAISDEVIKIKIGAVKTTHAKVGYKGTMKTPPPSAVIKKILGELADLPAEAAKEAKTVAELKAEIVSLKRQKPTISVSKEIEYRTDPKDIKAAIKETEDRMQAEFWKERDQWLEQINNWFSILKGIADSLMEWKRQNASKGKKIKFEPVDPKFFYSKSLPNTLAVKQNLTMPPFIPTEKEKEERNKILEHYNEGRISGPQQKIIDKIYWLETAGFETITKTQVALLCGIRPTGGTYANNLGVLRTAGLITYPRPGQVALTEAGQMKAYAHDKVLDTEELHKQIKENISGPQWAILEVLISQYPNPVSKTDIAESIGVIPSGGTYANNLGVLRSIGLIDYPSPGMAVALPVLFVR